MFHAALERDPERREPYLLQHDGVFWVPPPFVPPDDSSSSSSDSDSPRGRRSRDTDRRDRATRCFQIPCWILKEVSSLAQTMGPISLVLVLSHNAVQSPNILVRKRAPRPAYGEVSEKFPRFTTEEARALPFLVAKRATPADRDSLSRPLSREYSLGKRDDDERGFGVRRLEEVRSERRLSQATGAAAARSARRRLVFAKLFEYPGLSHKFPPQSARFGRVSRERRVLKRATEDRVYA